MSSLPDSIRQANWTCIRRLLGVPIGIGLIALGVWLLQARREVLERSVQTTALVKDTFSESHRDSMGMDSTTYCAVVEFEHSGQKYQTQAHGCVGRSDKARVKKGATVTIRYDPRDLANAWLTGDTTHAPLLLPILILIGGGLLTAVLLFLSVSAILHRLRLRASGGRIVVAPPDPSAPLLRAEGPVAIEREVEEADRGDGRARGGEELIDLKRR